jgi:hypothetical protein
METQRFVAPLGAIAAHIENLAGHAHDSRDPQGQLN